MTFVPPPPALLICLRRRRRLLLGSCLLPDRGRREMTGSLFVLLQRTLCA